MVRSEVRRPERARCAALQREPTLAPGEHPLVDGLPEPWAVEWGEDRFGVFTAFEVGGVVQRLRWVPCAPPFRMGSLPNDMWRFRDEEPTRVVRLTRGYWLGETSVTLALWRAVMGENPSGRLYGDKRHEHPVAGVSWKESERFIGALNARVAGLGVRLPTEAEWERACRAGTEAPRYGDLDGVAWFADNSGGATHPVKQKLPNPLGLYDMLGNVWEWCSDWWAASYAGAPSVDPTGPSTGSLRVVRGGSWNLEPRFVRAACRGGFDPGERNRDLGFRLARDHGSGQPQAGAVGRAGVRSRPP